MSLKCIQCSNRMFYVRISCVLKISKIIGKSQWKGRKRKGQVQLSISSRLIEVLIRGTQKSKGNGVLINTGTGLSVSPTALEEEMPFVP